MNKCLSVYISLITFFKFDLNKYLKLEADSALVSDALFQNTAPSTTVFTVDSDGKIQNKKARELDDSGSGESKVLGLKSKLIKSVKDQQGSLLSDTDWYIIRKADKGTAIPSNIQTWRDAIRTKATEMETAISDCSSVDDIAKLWLEVDEDGKKSGILYDWPSLGS